MALLTPQTSLLHLLHTRRKYRPSYAMAFWPRLSRPSHKRSHHRSHRCRDEDLVLDDSDPPGPSTPPVRSESDLNHPLPHFSSSNSSHSASSSHPASNLHSASEPYPADVVRPPALETTLTNGWLAADDFSGAQLGVAAERCFLELNFDWWDRHRPNVSSARPEPWQQLMRDYRAYCRIKCARRPFSTDIAIVRGVVHNAIGYFAGGRGNGELMEHALLAGRLLPGTLGSGIC